MDAESLVTALVRLQLAASAAILLVLLLRPLALRCCGAGSAYWLWLVVPLAAAASLLPAREQVVMIPAASDIPALRLQIEPDLIAGGTQEHATTAQAVQLVPEDRSKSGLLIGLWLLGTGALLIRSIVNTRRLASSPSIGPALVGVLRPRLVLPQDFEVRFNAEERALILAHEEMHRASRHALVNALVEVARCASWFNPLAHLAAWRFRADQELACDTAVIAANPQARRAYAEALLKSQVAGVLVPMGCVWTSATAGRLAERIARLSAQLPGRRRRFVGAASIVGIGIAASYAAWAQQPATIVTVQQPTPDSAAVAPDVSTPATSQVPVTTPAAQAPQGPLLKDAEKEPETPAFNGEHAPYDARMLQLISQFGDAWPGGAYMIEDAKLAYARDHQELWKDPAYRKLVLAEVRPKFERDFPGVTQELGLSEKEADSLFDLLADNAITREKIPVPDFILGRPTPAELTERQDVERRTMEILQANKRREDESIQALLGDKYAQWQVYRSRTMRIQAFERGQMTEERMRRSLARPPSVTADRAQLAAWRNLQEGLERIAAQNRKMRMELERDGLLPQLPQE